jgi:hypothetical protein
VREYLRHILLSCVKALSGDSIAIESDNSAVSVLSILADDHTVSVSYYVLMTTSSLESAQR